MASEETQRSWTGDHGYSLLRQTLAFTRIASHGFLRWTGQPLDNKLILDFGCGYGRFARLMYYFTDPSNYYGLDPWPLSIELCQKANLPGHLAVSDYLPTTLPVGDLKFDLIFAFSVFTHLSPRATGIALRTLRNYVRHTGLLVITIRPIDYWFLSNVKELVPETERLVATHRTNGFAFHPHVRAAVDGDITYGDTSMTISFLRDNFRQEWEVTQIDRSLDDPYQLAVFLKPNIVNK
jgi:SAM-dependent methyltransferase